MSELRSRLIALVLVAGAGAGAFAACDEGAPLGEAPSAVGSWTPDPGASAAAALERFAARGPYGFATREFVFVDETRETPPNRGYPGSPVRTLPARVYYPALPYSRAASPPPENPVPVAPGGPFPILGYAHGLTSLGAVGRFRGEHLASHSYIVVLPRFPLSSGDAPGGPTIADIPNQPADLDFVMRQVAELDGEDADLGAAVDESRRGILGFSAGGLTVLLAAHHPVLHIEDIDAAVAQAPVACFLGPGSYERPLPTLILAGTADELVPPEGPERAFALAPPPVILAELLGGTHSGFMNEERILVENSDRLECQRLLQVDPTEGTAEFAAGVTSGVGPSAIDATDCAAVCSQQFEQTMGATRQMAIARAATLAHFEAILRGRQDAAAFLAVGLDKLPDVEVQVKP